MMTPEEEKALLKKVNDLEELVYKLANSASMPLEFEAAMRDRLDIDDKATVIPSAVSPTAHNKAVNEAGTNTYSVMNIPTGFLQFTVGGNTYVIPYF